MSFDENPADDTQEHLWLAEIDRLKSQLKEQSKRLVDVRHQLATAWDEALSEAARICERDGSDNASHCADLIRAAKKEKP